jgi:transketolase
MRERSLQAIHQIAKLDSRVLFIGSDLGHGVLDQFRHDFPERYFMEGVSEQAVLGLAAGLALEGFTPFVNTIATFLTRRCYEQIAIDLCLQNVSVRLLGYGGGVVYAPLGPTHLATDDIAILRALPNMTIIAPCDAEEIERVIVATCQWDGPVYIRLARGEDRVVSQAALGFEIGKAILLRPPGDVLFVTTGVMAQRALDAVAALDVRGIEAGVLHVHTVKPLDEDTLLLHAAGVNLVVTVEEHVRNGGFGSAVLECLSENLGPQSPTVVRMGLPDAFVEGYGSQEYLLAKYGLDASNLVSTVLRSAGSKIVQH